MMNKSALVLAALALSVPTQAHDIKIASASGLLANCSYKSKDEAENEFHTGFCLGFIKAVMNLHPTHGETFCLTEATSNEDLIQAVLQTLYVLKAEDLSEAPSTLVVAVALENFFPCSKSR